MNGMKATIGGILGAGMGLAVTAAAAQDLPKVDLWKGATSGMTVDEVAPLFEDAQRVNGDTLITGFEERLRIAPYDLGGEPYQVKFFFDARHLRVVLLSRQFEENDVAATTKACDTRLAALRDTYGKETDAEINLESDLFSLNRTFTFHQEGLEVTLLCLGSEYTSVVNFGFSPRADEMPDAQIHGD